jgi:hypothetical protein
MWDGHARLDPAHPLADNALEQPFLTREGFALCLRRLVTKRSRNRLPVGRAQHEFPGGALSRLGRGSV